MKKSIWIFVSTVFFSALMAQADPYPLGSMTCKDIGAFASQAMQWRESGLVPKDARQRLDELKPDNSVEKKNMLMAGMIRGCRPS